MPRQYNRALLPALPQAADAGPDKQWADELIKQLYLALSQVRSPSAFRTSILTLQDCPVSGYGLAEGDVWADNGVLKIVRATDIFAPSFSTLGRFGTVTVSS